MTTHYIDIRVIADPEISQTHIMGTLVGKLHLALVNLRTNAVGISFPVYSLLPKSLGAILRLHGTSDVLIALMDTHWMHGIVDYTKVSALSLVPADVQHRVVRRKQFKTNIDRLRRRRMARKGETAEQAACAIPSLATPKPNVPYVQIRSSSTKQAFSLFVEHGELLNAPVCGVFNSYGLSDEATVPWF